MRALIVGAGAVGQVYGYHLQRGGAEVSFLVRPRYAEDCRKGFALYPLNRRRPRERPVRFEGFGVLTSAAEVARERWGQVWLAMSSAGLRGAWLEELAAVIGDATVVTLQPGPDDREHLLAMVPAERLVAGIITLVSYHAPLPGESVPEPGMAYWFPPLAPSAFSGPAERARAVVRALRAGRQPAAVHRDVPREVAYPSALFMAAVAALEWADWSLSGLDPATHLRVAFAALAEMKAVIARRFHSRPPFWLRLLGPRRLRAFLLLGARLAPFPLETYLRAHFSKVREQTRLVLQSFAARAAAEGLPARAVAELESKLAPHGIGAGA